MNIPLRIVGILLRVLNVLLLPLVKFVGGSKRRTPFPEIRNEMLQVPAVDLAERIRNKEVGKSYFVYIQSRLEYPKLRLSEVSIIIFILFFFAQH